MLPSLWMQWHWEVPALGAPTSTLRRLPKEWGVAFADVTFKAPGDKIDIDTDNWIPLYALCVAAYDAVQVPSSMTNTRGDKAAGYPAMSIALAPLKKGTLSSLEDEPYPDMIHQVRAQKQNLQMKCFLSVWFLAWRVTMPSCISADCIAWHDESAGRQLLQMPLKSHILEWWKLQAWLVLHCHVST